MSCLNPPFHSRHRCHLFLDPVVLPTNATTRSAAEETITYRLSRDIRICFSSTIVQETIFSNANVGIQFRVQGTQVESDPLDGGRNVGTQFLKHGCGS